MKHIMQLRSDGKKDMISESRLDEWIKLYLDYVADIGTEAHVAKDEGYKFKAVDTFQKNFNLEATDLAENIEAAIEHNNLVAGNMYWPKKMLQLFAEEYEEETRTALKLLFNEEIDISDRINQSQAVFDDLIVKRNKRLGEAANSFISLRFLSLLLGFHFPDKYPAVKPREWNVFCKYIDDDFRIPNGTSTGDRYKVLTTYIEALNKKIRVLPEIQKIKEALTRGLEFTDSNFNWMTQDVIYVTARIIASRKEPLVVSAEVISESEESNEQLESLTSQAMLFPLETYLENFLIKNWAQIDFGEKLTIHTDEDGSPAQQYPTSEGFIDILAKDADDNFVVIELKRGRSKQEVVGQILSYIGWVKKNLAGKNQKVRGIIIVSDGNQSLLDAVSAIQDFVSIKYYRVNFSFEDPV